MFSDFPNWTGYPPSPATPHPVNARFGHANDPVVPMPSGDYRVVPLEGTEGAVNTDTWRQELRDQVDAIKDRMLTAQPGTRREAYEDPAKRELESRYGLGWLDLWLDGARWSGHHIHPANWGGSDEDDNFQYLRNREHSPFTTWWNRRAREIRTELGIP